MCDGEAYRELYFLTQPSKVFNTKRVALLHYSTVSLWPIWLVVRFTYRFLEGSSLTTSHISESETVE